MPDARQVDTELRELIALALERVESGGDAALDEFIADHQGRADEIRRFVADLRTRGLLDPARALDAPLPERLGEFRLIRRLGSGGMGVVWLAEQETLKRKVALKILQPAQLLFPHARERFRREIDSVARLEHPGIVRVLTVGDDVGLPWFAMEHVAGASLSEVLRELAGRDPATVTAADLRETIARIAARNADGDPLAGDEVLAQRVFGGTFAQACLAIAAQAAEALAHAHARGVLHRDVKPSNVMVTPDGRARLVDFGLAQLEGATRLTRSGANPGSLPYMSPEQIDGHAALDARTDLYSLGVTLYELLTLRPAFDSESSELTRRRILAGDAAPPRRLHAGLPRDVETVCMTAMQRDPRRRHADAAALARDLDAARTGAPILAQRPGAVERLGALVRRRPVRALAAACVVLMIGAAALFVQWQRADERATFQRALRAVLLAGWQGEEPTPTDLATVAKQLPAAEGARMLALLRADPLSKERWRELRELLPSYARGETAERTAGATGATRSEVATTTSVRAAPLDSAERAAIEAEFVRYASGDATVDRSLRVALLLARGAADDALNELTSWPAELAPDERARKTWFAGQAQVLRSDPERFLEARGEAADEAVGAGEPKARSSTAPSAREQGSLRK